MSTTVSADIGAILAGIAAILSAIATAHAGRAGRSVDSMAKSLAPDDAGHTLAETVRLVDDKVDMLGDTLANYQRAQTSALADIRHRLGGLESIHRRTPAARARRKRR